MNEGGSILTLSFGGSLKVMPNYNVMGVAKAALEASVRYLALDYGKKGIRVNAISAGPMRTLSGAGVGGAREIYNYAEKHSPLKGHLSLDNVGSAGLYLLSDLSKGVTGEIHYVDLGYNIIGMPKPE
jgi:enoyl-[acyl-carrier protein] reductase I